MRSQALSVGVLLLLGSCAFGQSFDMTIHLATGETVTIPNDDILRIEFANLPTSAPDPAAPESVARMFQLLRNYPNPFNPSTTIEYQIPDPAEVSVRVYDLHGALVAELLHETQTAGVHSVTWDGTDSNRTPVASGVYLYAVECGGSALSKRLILVK